MRRGRACHDPERPLAAVEFGWSCRRRRAQTGWTWLGKGSIIHARARIVACQELTVETFETYMYIYRTQHRLEAAGPPYARTFALWLEAGGRAAVQLLEKPTAIFKPWGTVGWSIARSQRADLPMRTRRGCARSKACLVQKKQSKLLQERN